VTKEKMKFDVLIVGAGHGGAQTAAMLRQLKFDGSIALIGDEPDLPYERPPLSKEYFAGEKTFERILLRPEQFWREQDVTMILGERVVSIDAEEKTVETESGTRFRYEALVWAAGGAPKMPPIKGCDAPNVFGLRTKTDADVMKQAAQDAQTVAVIGGGYIGLEAAAVLTTAGKKVTVIEMMDRVLARVAGEPLSRFYENEHRARGVNFRLNATVQAIEADETATGVRLSDGETIAADFILVGVGIAPAIEPLAAAGAKVENGVIVDEFCRTSLPDVYAIGDCAAHANRFADGAVIRLESVQNANDQGRTAARSICGKPAPYDAVPWFWSNQYDLRLQTIGLCGDYDDTVVRGSIDDRSFSVIYLKKGRVIALDCVNAPADYAAGRLLVMKGAAPSTADLANPEIALKDLALS
jgi:3-phenylpropionate/trans-cinnamate dioxygenase ferredoxin reductase subunit